MNEGDFDKIDSMIARHIGVFAESINHKLDIVVEGHQMLSERIDRFKFELDQRIDCVEHKLITVAALASATTEKLDAVAADIKAHRADTEVHKKVYNIKED